MRHVINGNIIRQNERSLGGPKVRTLKRDLYVKYRNFLCHCKHLEEKSRANKNWTTCVQEAQTSKKFGRGAFRSGQLLARYSLVYVS